MKLCEICGKEKATDTVKDFSGSKKIFVCKKCKERARI
jgi:hypothetical protein